MQPSGSRLTLRSESLIVKLVDASCRAAKVNQTTEMNAVRRATSLNLSLLGRRHSSRAQHAAGLGDAIAARAMTASVR